MVIDFSILKERVGGWIDEHWDHNFLAHPSDPLLEQQHLFEKPPYTMSEDYPNPTAENLARMLFGLCRTVLPELKVVNVRLYETPNCWTDFHD